MIKEISAAETYSVRHPVLRAGKPVESCHFDGDDLATTRHFGVYKDGELAGVASLFEARHPELPELSQFQLRGMAVHQAFQGTGLGQQLLRYGENEISSRGGELIWFNARAGALQFYAKNGYITFKGPFEISGIGTHYVMYKQLKP